MLGRSANKAKESGLTLQQTGLSKGPPQTTASGGVASHAERGQEDVGGCIQVNSQNFNNYLYRSK